MAYLQLRWTYIVATILIMSETVKDLYTLFSPLSGIKKGKASHHIFEFIYHPFLFMYILNNYTKLQQLCSKWYVQSDQNYVQINNSQLKWAVSWENQHFAFCENKDADQLRSNRVADQHLFFATWIEQYLHFLNTKFPASSHLQCCTAWFVSDLVRIHIVGFLTLRLNELHQNETNNMVCILKKNQISPGNCPVLSKYFPCNGWIP